MRRRLLPALALALAACAKGSETTSAAPTGGTLVIASPGDADVLLPPVLTTQVGKQIADLIFPRLAELKLDLNTVDDSGFAPSLARSWEHRDSLTLAFHLDPRARWQDGAPVTAHDVVFTWGVYGDTLVGAPELPNLADIAAVEAEDSLTAVFRFRHARPEQLLDATYHMRILPRHLLDAIPRGQLASAPFGRDPVGVGPFRFVRWTPGAELVLEADTAFFLGRPRLDRIVWRVLPDVSAAVSALIAGEADAMETIPQRDEIERVLRAPDLRLVPYPSPFLGGIAFNLRQPLFLDRELRRALAMAIDRETIVRSIFGPYGEVPVGSTVRMQWISQGPVRQLGYDTVEAKRTLEAEGWRDLNGDGLREKNGAPLRFTLLVPTTSRTRQQAAVLVQDQLKKVGVDVRIQPLDFPVMMQRSEHGEFEAVFFSRTLEASPSTLTTDWSTSAIGGVNWGAYASPAFDSIVTAALAARTRGAAAPLFRRALEMLNDDAPAVFVYSPRNNAAVHRRFENVTIRPDSWLVTVATWSVPPDRRLPRDR